MSLFDLFRGRRDRERERSADVAKERLQIVLAYERTDRSGPDFLPLLQKEILQVIEKYVKVESNKIAVKLQRGKDISLLEVDIELPGSTGVPETPAPPVGAAPVGAAANPG